MIAFGLRNNPRIGGSTKMDDILISRAIINSFVTDFLDAMEVDVAVAGAGPAGMTAA